MLGLADTPMFGQSETPDGDHHLLLDGVSGSFGLSKVNHQDMIENARSWAWSSGVLHHVSTDEKSVLVRRWDRSEVLRYSYYAVDDDIDRFYSSLSEEQSTISKTVTSHAVDAFRRLRSSYPIREPGEALGVFLLLLSAMRDRADDIVFDMADDLAAKYKLPDGASFALRRLSPDLVLHILRGFRKPILPGGSAIDTIPTLLLRHVGAMVFQEAHLELVSRGITDLFGIPEAASIMDSSSNGVHFTPPGLARALVEQAILSFGSLPNTIDVMDPACGSGSILHELLRTLHDRGFRGYVNVYGYDISQSAVDIAKFYLTALADEWPGIDIKLTVEKRDSLDESGWPKCDIIIMNPPFVSLRALNDGQKKHINRILGRFSKGRPDLSMAFLERAVYSLKETGVLASLIPAGILSMTHAREWRRHLMDKVSVRLVASFSETSLFRMATVELGALVLKKEINVTSDTYRSLWVGERRSATSDALRYLRKAKNSFGSAKTDLWSLDESSPSHLATAQSWRPRPRFLQSDLERLSGIIPTKVADLFDVRQGALPAPRQAFIIGEEQFAAFSVMERRWFRRVAENANIRSGHITRGEYIFFPKTLNLPEINSAEQLRGEIPNFFKHISLFKDDLCKRRGKTERWWELGEDRKWLRSPAKKIVSAYFGKSGSFAFDSDGDYVVVQGYGWLPAWGRAGRDINIELVLHAYVALLNTDVFSQILSEFCPVVGGGQFNLSKRFITNVPLPDMILRASRSDNQDSVVNDLAKIGERIRKRGLELSPINQAEELARVLYGV